MIVVRLDGHARITTPYFVERAFDNNLCIVGLVAKVSWTSSLHDQFEDLEHYQF
jgi:hypothetical protein